MSLVFQQGSTLIITNGQASRELLVSSASISQTFLEESQSVKTIHNRKAIANTFTNEKSAANFDFDVYLTEDDGLLLEWMGLTPGQGGIYNFNWLNDVPQGWTIYLKRTGGTYRLTNPVSLSTSFSFDFRANPLQLSISGTASNWTQVPTIVAPNLTKQQSSKFITGSLELAGYPYLAGFTLEYTKDVSWSDNKNIQKVLAGNIHTPNLPLISDIALGGTISLYKRDDTLEYTPNTIIDFMYGEDFHLYISNARVLDRWETSEVDMKREDFKAQPSSQAYIHI